MTAQARITVHPPDLERKFSRKLDQRKTIQLTPEEMDLIVDCGAYDAICRAAQEFRKAQCRERSARNRTINGAPLPSTVGKDETLKSSGTMKPPNASEALARAQAMLNKGG